MTFPKATAQQALHLQPVHWHPSWQAGFDQRGDHSVISLSFMRGAPISPPSTRSQGCYGLDRSESILLQGCSKVTTLHRFLCNLPQLKLQGFLCDSSMFRLAQFAHPCWHITCHLGYKHKHDRSWRNNDRPTTDSACQNGGAPYEGKNPCLCAPGFYFNYHSSRPGAAAEENPSDRNPSFCLPLPLSRPALRHSGKGCASWDMWRGKTFSLSLDMQRENSIVSVLAP